MGRIIARVLGIDRRRDRRIRIGLRMREGIGLREEMPGVVLEAGVLVEALEVRPGEILVIGLAGVRRELLEIGRGVMRVREGTAREEILRVMLEEEGLVGILEMLCRVGLGLRGMQGLVVRLRTRVGRRPITRGLLGIRMRDFRREVEAVTDRKGSNGHRVSLSNGRRDNLSSGLSRDRRLPGLVRVDLAVITMAERRGLRAIAAEPVLVVVGVREGNADETSQS
jgi:hypothetical protein